MKKILFFVCLVMVTSMMVYAAGGQDRGFERLPLNEQIERIDMRIKEAVNALAEGLDRPTVTKIGLFTLENTDMPAGLSRYLSERVKQHANENQDNKFHVIDDGTYIDNAQVVIISGFFSKTREHVSVTMELILSDGDKIGEQVISVPVYFVAQVLGIEIEPENIDIREELEIVLDDIGINNEEHEISASTSATTSVAQKINVINIYAVFNSESMTYFHRDELKMTITADRNCFFKVIHIDSTNQIKMIYPNEYDKNNSLRANIPRVIFETANYMLYEPYGAESIIIVASEQQFPNIEREYITPWTNATTETVRSAVRGFRGGELEAGSKPNITSTDGEVIYTITVLKPHEEYIYEKPARMSEVVDFFRNDARRQGGTFTGNETSGFYIANGIRGSYRIPREAPNEIRFAYYFLDNYTGGTRAGVRTRGTGFDFSFSKPQNLSQAVSSAKTSFQAKGGTFSGNEQQGTFKANGIAGQYRVADMVNVTIMEKPFLIPNSLIEREVRNFFGQR